MDPVGDVDFAAAPATLLIVIREDCRFCQDSIPFYRQLSDARIKQPGSGVRLVVASTDVSESLASFLKSKEIRVDHISNVQAGDLKVPGTPALLLIDRSGKVAKVWRGRLAERQQKEVLLTLGLVPAE